MSVRRLTDRLNHSTEMPTATTVSAPDASDLVTTNVPTDWVNCSHRAREALTKPISDGVS